MINKHRRVFLQFCLLAVTFLASMGIFTLSYRYDNKYTSHSAQPINGIFFYTPDQGTVHLVNGWEFYRGQLLSPEDWALSTEGGALSTEAGALSTEAGALSTEAGALSMRSGKTAPQLPDGCLAIGQYPGMEAGDPDASPHGSITYRLTLCLPDTPALYTLELPEIYSAYRLWLNGRLAASQGNPEPDVYVPALKSGSLTFEGSGDVTLLLAVSDWSHLYSGLVYPPAFGPAGQVETLLNQKLAWGLTAMVLALVLGLFQLVLSVLLKSRRSLYSGLICAAFAVSVSSPVIHRLMTTGIVPYYNLEIFCRYAIYGLAALLVAELCREPGEKQEHGAAWAQRRGAFGSLSIAVTALAAAFPFAALCVSLMAPELTREQMILFSSGAGAYKLLCSLWLLFTVFRVGLCKEQTASTAVLLAGIGVFSSSLAADRLYRDFEPIRFGWFSETAGLVFVLVLSFLMLRDSALLYRRQFLFAQQKKQLEGQIAMQKRHYSELAGQMEAIRAMRHDIRHHLNQISALLSDGNSAAAGDYVSRLTKSTLTASPLSFCDAYYVDVLLRFYDAKARELKVPFAIEAHVPEDPGILEEDLCVILGNLLENALEASLKVPPAFRQMSTALKFENGALAIEVKNCCISSAVSDGGHVSSKGPGLHGIVHISSKGPGLHGIGLPSVRQTVEKYGGNVWTSMEEGENGVPVFLAQVLVLTEKPA